MIGFDIAWLYVVRIGSSLTFTVWNLALWYRIVVSHSPGFAVLLFRSFVLSQFFFHTFAVSYFRYFALSLFLFFVLSLFRNVLWIHHNQCSLLDFCYVIINIIASSWFLWRSHRHSLRPKRHPICILLLVMIPACERGSSLNMHEGEEPSVNQRL